MVGTKQLMQLCFRLGGRGGKALGTGREVEAVKGGGVNVSKHGVVSGLGL